MKMAIRAVIVSRWRKDFGGVGGGMGGGPGGKRRAERLDSSQCKVLSPDCSLDLGHGIEAADPRLLVLRSYKVLRFHGREAALLINIQGSAKRRCCLLSYSQAEPGKELTQPSPRLLAEPCREEEAQSRHKNVI